MWRVSWAMIFIAGFFGEAASSQEVKCGEDYVARKGDTAHGVVTKVQGSSLHRQLLVNALSAKYGGVGGVITEGTVMSIPCAASEGVDLPTEFWSSVSYKPLGITVQLAEMRNDSGTDLYGAKLLFSALLDGAMQKSLFVPKYRKLSAKDREMLAPFPKGQDAGGISFPWLGSDCEAGSASRRLSSPLCADAYWSDPLFDITSSFYSLETGGAANVDLQAGRFCVAYESRAAVAASSVIDIGLIENATAGTAIQCADMLAARTVAVAILPDVVAAAINRSPGQARRIKRVLDLTFSDKVHAVVDKANPNAERILKRFNEGIAAIRISGDWYQIVVAELRKPNIN